MSKIKYNRGTTMAITHTYQKNGEPSDAGETLFFTVKPDEFDTSANDSTATVKKDVTMNGATNIITIEATDIDDTVEPGTYYYDVKVKENGGNIYLVDSGEFIINATPTNREA